MAAGVDFEKCSVVLLDVAGTTTSLNFVKDTLYPYVLKQAEPFLKANWDDAEVQKAVKLLLQDQVAEEATAASVAPVFKELSEKDSNNEGVKNLQGLIARTGYEDGSLKGHVFSDVPKSLEAWVKARKVAIYSTGSVDAQKLLFVHSTAGDLSAHITQYFDGAVGAKTEATSYGKVAEKLDVKPEQIVFISDLLEELKAAKEAGLTAVLIKREGNPEVTDDSFPAISSFSELFSPSSKRKNEDDEVDASAEAPPTKVAKTVKEDAADSMDVDATSKDETKKKEAVINNEETHKMEVTESADKAEQTNGKAEDVKDDGKGTEKTKESSIETETNPQAEAEIKKPEIIETKEAEAVAETKVSEDGVETKEVKTPTDVVETKETEKTDGTKTENEAVEKVMEIAEAKEVVVDEPEVMETTTEPDVTETKEVAVTQAKASEVAEVKVVADTIEAKDAEVRETEVTETHSVEQTKQTEVVTVVEDKNGSEAVPEPKNEVAETKGAEVTVTKVTEVTGTEGTKVTETKGTEVTETEGTKVTETKGTEVTETEGTKVTESKGTKVTEIKDAEVTAEVKKTEVTKDNVEESEKAVETKIAEVVEEKKEPKVVVDDNGGAEEVVKAGENGVTINGDAEETKENGATNGTCVANGSEESQIKVKKVETAATEESTPVVV